MFMRLITLPMLVLSIIISIDVPAADVLEEARKASVAASEALQSAQGSGTFTEHRRNLTDKDEMLWTEGSFKFSYQSGKYFIDITLKKLLRRTRYEDEMGQFTEKIVDWSPDRVVLVYDGQAASVVTFTGRINPTGCRVEIFDSMRTATALASFPLRNPAKPWLEVLDVDAVLKNIERDAITVSTLDNGRTRIAFDIKNSKSAYAEFELDPQSGNNVISSRTFNRPELEPAVTRRLSWAQTESVWYVRQFDAVHRYPPSSIPAYRARTMVAFDSFAPNKLIDDTLFKIESLPIPPGTRTLDRRPGH